MEHDSPHQEGAAVKRPLEMDNQSEGPSDKKAKTTHDCDKAPEVVNGQAVESVKQTESSTMREDEGMQSLVLDESEEKVIAKASNNCPPNGRTEITEPKEEYQSQMSTADSGDPMTEKDVGITEYLGSHLESFSAIIKQRYSDFIVNEIDENGKVVHLTSVTHEEEEMETGVKQDKKVDEKAMEILAEADRDALDAMVLEKKKDATHDILAPDDKEARTKVHQAVKTTFPQLETRTTDNAQGVKVIQVLWRKGNSRDSHSKDNWPESKKSCRYVRFVLYKENKDTMDTIGLIAKNLKVKENLFQYAGTKDKRAKTTQEVTANRIHPRKLVGLNKVLWNMGLGHFRYVEKPLQLGQLSGNQFIIVLRNIKKSQVVVDAALTSLKENGFINYFGMQRFGTTSIPTHRIGSALLKGNWEKAIDLILTPRNDNPAKDKFQKVWASTKDAKATLDATPRFCGLERKLLEALARNAKPFNALEKLSRNTRLLYVHSYQSLVWNKMASKRVSQLGKEVVVGDLVLPKTHGTDSPKPIIVTEDNRKQFTMTDVVLPLPGHDVIYPENQVRDWYRDLLAEDELDIDGMKRPQKDYSLPGAYRPLIILPQDVSWSHRRYDDYTQPLTLSDLDQVQGIKLKDSPDSGCMSAVILRLSLPPSCYATMALREAMRVDTSSFQQTQLNTTS